MVAAATTVAWVEAQLLKMLPRFILSFFLSHFGDFWSFGDFNALAQH